MATAKKPAKRGLSGLSESVQLRRQEQTETSPNHNRRQRLSRSQACELASEYRAAAQRNTAAALQLGGYHGDALRRLAQHYAARAVALGVQAGGANV